MQEAPEVDAGRAPDPKRDDRRTWRARAGVPIRRVNWVWDFTGFASIFPAMMMVYAGVGRGKSRVPPLTTDETWVWLLVSASVMLALVASTGVQRLRGIVPIDYPKGRFILALVTATISPIFALLRLGGEVTTPTAGITALAVCVVLAVLSIALMFHPGTSAGSAQSEAAPGVDGGTG